MSNTAIAFLLAGVLLNAAAQLLLKAGTTAIGEFEYTAGNILDAGLRYALQPYIVAGLSCYVVSVVVWSGVASLILIEIVKRTTGLRARDEAIEDGLDLSAHGERAYHP